MDDLEQVLGIKYSPEQQATLKELARRKNDRLRVQNLLDEDYYVEWAIHDEKEPGGRFLVPAVTHDIGYGLGQAVYPRYIAFKFFKEVCQKILDHEAKQRIDQENEVRVARGQKKMDKTLETGEELAFTLQFRSEQNDKKMELLPKIILGIEQEWGMDATPVVKSEDTVKWNKVMELINRPVNKQAPAQPTFSAATVDTASVEDTLKEIAAA